MTNATIHILALRKAIDAACQDAIIHGSGFLMVTPDGAQHIAIERVLIDGEPHPNAKAETANDILSEMVVAARNTRGSP